jgi:hypothetical protein
LSEPVPSPSRRAGLLAITASAAGILLPTSVRAMCDPAASVTPELAPRTSGRVLRVAAGERLRSLAETARAARDGDTIEVESGDYLGDVSVWPQSDLIIRGVGPRPRIIADGRSAEGKGILVLKGQRVSIENIEFRDARVRDRNGAGIRVENGPLTVSNCAFTDNENGMLVGNLPSIDLSIENSSFEGNGNESGSAHNLYVGTVNRLKVSGCYFARSRVGHLLKSRAKQNFIRYCRLTGEDGTSSYELEFPNGGRAVVVGNLIQQGRMSENSTIVAYGAEGYRSPDNVLVMAFNTLVNDRPGSATFVRVAKGAERAVLVNNLLVGAGSLAIDAPLESRGNVEARALEFANPAAMDYRLRKSSSLVGRAGFRGAAKDEAILPQREYDHKARSCAIESASALTPLSPGAFQRLAT